MKHETYIPDCPSCGTEMVPAMRYITGITPYGKPERWWECPKCHHETAHVLSEDFAEFTQKLIVEKEEEM